MEFYDQGKKGDRESDARRRRETQTAQRETEVARSTPKEKDFSSNRQLMPSRELRLPRKLARSAEDLLFTRGFISVLMAILGSLEFIKTCPITCPLNISRENVGLSDSDV